MLTAAQKSRCRELAQALDAGDFAAYKRAEPSLTPEMKGEVWDMRAHVIAAGGRASKAGAVLNQSGSKPPRPPRVETELHDLDYWATDDDQDDGGDDDGDGDVTPCPACNGRGKDSAGNRCEACEGTGKAPLDDDREDDDDEREDED